MLQIFFTSFFVLFSTIANAQSNAMHLSYEIDPFTLNGDGVSWLSATTVDGMNITIACQLGTNGTTDTVVQVGNQTFSAIAYGLHSAEDLASDRLKYCRQIQEIFSRNLGINDRTVMNLHFQEIHLLDAYRLDVSVSSSLTRLDGKRIHAR